MHTQLSHVGCLSCAIDISLYHRASHTRMMFCLGGYCAVWSLQSSWCLPVLALQPTTTRQHGSQMPCTNTSIKATRSISATDAACCSSPVGSTRRA
jgi:hypothetical protein